MHFDVFSDKKEIEIAIQYAKKWRSSIGEKDTKVTLEECKFCHSQSVPGEIEIMTDGYYISKIEGRTE